MDNALYCSSMTGESPEESCAPVDFVVPGLDGFQFVAWGTRHGMVYVGYYSRNDSDVVNSHIRTVLGLSLADDGHGCGAVCRVEYGGGPHALLAAATDTCLAVFRLDRLMYDLVSLQDWLGNGGDTMDVYRVCHVEREVSVYEPGSLGCVLGMSWTHQLDGILITDSESRVQMWRMYTRDHVSELSLFWETRSSGPQKHVSAGAWAGSPCVTAGDHGVYVWWYKDCVTCETLKHPTKVVHVEWSPGTLRKDILEESSSAESDATEDHPAIMTLDKDGCVRIWVEMVVMRGDYNGQDGTARNPLSQSDSYFAMTLMFNTLQSGSSEAEKRSVFCSWVKPLDSILGLSRAGGSLQSHILWLIVGYHAKERGSVTLSLYAVRGLTAVVVSSFSVGMIGSQNTVKTSKKPQIVLWGSFLWDSGLPFDVSQCKGRSATFTARMVYGDEFPEIHCLETLYGDDASTIMSSGICLGTCMKETLPNSPASIHQRLYLRETWKGFGQMHRCDIVAIEMIHDYVISLDVDGCLILWDLGDTKDSLCYCCSIQLESRHILEHSVYMKAFSSDKHMCSIVLVIGTLVYRLSIVHKSVSVVGRHAIDNASGLHAGMSGDELCIISMKENGTHISSSFYTEKVKLESPVFMNIDKDDKVIHVEEIGSHCDGMLLLVGTSLGQIGILNAKYTKETQQFCVLEIDTCLIPRGDVESFVCMRYEKNHRLLAALDVSQRQIHVYSISDNGASMCGIFRASDDQTISSVIWMPEEVVPCMAIGYHDGQVSICALHNLSFNSWQVVARFTSIYKNSPIKLLYSHNHLISISGSAMSMFGESILGCDSSSVCMGRVLLKTAGPLPLYHPRMMRSFLVSGHINTFFGILRSFLDWLEALDVEMESNDSMSYHASDMTSPKTSGGDEFINALEQGNVFLPFQTPSSDSLISRNNIDLSKYLGKLQGVLSGGKDSRLNEPEIHQDKATSHESGMLDMAAFGMGGVSIAPEPSVPSYESGMLDLAAFGMNGASVAPEPSVPSHENGMQEEKHEKHFHICQAEKMTAMQCKSHLETITKLCDRMESIQSTKECDTSDFSKHIFGLNKSVFVTLKHALKASRLVLNSIMQDIDKPSLIFLLCLAWSEGEGDQNMETQEDTSSTSLNDNLYRNMGLKNAAGVSFDFSARHQPDGVKPTLPCGVTSKLGLSPLVSVDSLVWMSLSSSDSSHILSVLERLQEERNNADRAHVGQGSWETLKSAGVALWLRDKQELGKLVEEAARTTFRETRDPDQAALLYAAIGKIAILQGLYRTCNKSKQAEFFSRDFSQETNQTAACKNAFVLLSQHRYSMAATFFILGGKVKDAIEICIHQLEDIQLAIMLYKMLGETSFDIGEAIDEFLKPHTGSAVEFLKHWIMGDLEESITALSIVCQPSESVWLLPTLIQLIQLAPEGTKNIDQKTIDDLKDSIYHACIKSSEILSRNGMPWLSLELDMAASAYVNTKQTDDHRKSLSNTCALALIDTPIDLLPESSTEEIFHERIHHYLSQAEELRSLGLDISCNTVLHKIEHIYKTIATHHRSEMKYVGTPKSIDGSSLGRSLSIDSQALQSGRSSLRKSHDEQRDLARMLKKSQTFKDLEESPLQIVYPKGVEIFKVDGDILNSICSCPLLAPDVCGRLVAISTTKNGILEFATHPDVKMSREEDRLYMENRSPFHESPTMAGGPNKGGIFSKFVSQIFDQASWVTDPLEDSSTMIDGDIGLAAVSAISSRSSERPPLADAKKTVSKMLASHPQRQLFLSGCKDTGRIKLWQYDGPRPLRLFTPVPYQDLKELKSNPDMFSFSSGFARTHSMTSKMSHWGKAVDICFSENGERFASIGEGGLVAVWRLSSGFNKHSDVDGATCSEWWHTCIQQQGRSISFVGGGSVVIAAAGSCNVGNISLWDTSESKPACVGRLTHHKAPVNRIRTLPGGWLLIAGDDSGNLSVSDVRMLGSSDKKALLWNVKACKGKIQAIDTISYDTSLLPRSRTSKRNLLGTDHAIVTGGEDGIVRLWDPCNGSLFQQSHQVYHSSKPKIFGETKYSITDMTVCDEGIMSTGTDGIVRLFPKL